MTLPIILLAILLAASQTRASYTNFKDAIRKQVDEQTNTITLLESNSGFHSMVHTWLHHAKQVGALSSALVVALDQSEYNRLAKLGVPVFYDTSGTNMPFDTQAQGFRSKAYNRIVFHKWIIALNALSIGVNVLLTDADVIWLKNPLPGLARNYPNCSILASCEDSLNSEPPTWVNTGFMYLRATERTIKFITAFLRWCEVHETKMQDMDDQYKWQMFTEKNPSMTNTPIADADQRCMSYSNGASKLDLFMLPRVQYMNFKHWNEATHTQQSNAITLHYNWLNGLAEKRKNMELRGHWVKQNN